MTGKDAEMMIKIGDAVEEQMSVDGFAIKSANPLLRIIGLTLTTHDQTLAKKYIYKSGISVACSVLATATNAYKEHCDTGTDCMKEDPDFKEIKTVMGEIDNIQATLKESSMEGAGVVPWLQPHVEAAEKCVVAAGGGAVTAASHRISKIVDASIVTSRGCEDGSVWHAPLDKTTELTAAVDLASTTLFKLEENFAEVAADLKQAEQSYVDVCKLFQSPQDEKLVTDARALRKALVLTRTEQLLARLFTEENEAKHDKVHKENVVRKLKKELLESKQKWDGTVVFRPLYTRAVDAMRQRGP